MTRSIEKRISDLEIASGARRRGRKVAIWTTPDGEPVEPIPDDIGPDDELIFVSWGHPVDPIHHE